MYPGKLLVADLVSSPEAGSLVRSALAPHLEVCQYFCESQCSSGVEWEILYCFIANTKCVIRGNRVHQ